MYPSDEWNFTLGEASSVDGCAAMCFGRHEPKESQRLYHQNKKENNDLSKLKSNRNEQCCSKKEKTIFVSESCVENSVTSLQTNGIGKDEGKENYKDCRKSCEDGKELESDCDNLACELFSVENVSSLKTSVKEGIDKIDAYQLWKFFRVSGSCHVKHGHFRVFQRTKKFL